MISSRDASYTTQPLELLNDLDLENSRHNALMTRNLDAVPGDLPSRMPSDRGQLDSNLHNGMGNGHAGEDVAAQSPTASVMMDRNQGLGQLVDSEGSEGFHITQHGYFL